MMLALTAGDVNAFYRGSHPELKQIIVWIMAFGSIGACLGMLTYGIHQMVSRSDIDSSHGFSGSADNHRLNIGRGWLHFDNAARDPYRVVWTEEEIARDFDHESVRWHNFEKTAEGYIVTYQGKVVHPYKPVNNLQVWLFVIGIGLLVVVLAIPTLIWAAVNLGIMIPVMFTIKKWRSHEGSN